jgi:lysozyme
MKRWVHYGGASALAVALIAGFEGYRGAAYDDGGGVQTVGFGSTQGITPASKIDPVRAVQRLAQDADSHTRELARCIGAVPLSEGEWTAYQSWAYNIGTNAACSSTLVKLLHKTPPDYAGACNQLLRWDKDNGRAVAGLTNRRAQEYRLCNGGLND